MMRKEWFDPRSETMEELGRAGMRLIQPKKQFRYGTDSVLLSDFAASRRFTRAIDLGAGSGVIALLIAARMPAARVDCVELQPWAADILERNILLNGMQERVRAHCGDLREAAAVFGREQYDLAVSNPPYYDATVSLRSPIEEINTARQDGDCTPGELCRAAFSLIKTGGRFAAVFPAARAMALLRAMEENRIAPKRIRCVQDTPSRAPKLLLIEGVKQGGEGLIWLPPLLLHEENGEPSAEYRRIYDF
ncbi:MAG: methyltransferase [Eubacteriales bacterium]|nr:methyltransferase [Eubacteriales bacterium]